MGWLGDFALCVECPYCGSDAGARCVIAKGQYKGRAVPCHAPRIRLAKIYRKNQDQGMVGEWFGDTQHGHIRVCLRCGCAVVNTERAKEMHLDWHRRLDGLGMA